jgi:TatD DNase family protein
MASLVDTHCHIDFDVFEEDRSALLSRCREQGLAAIVVPGVSRQHWARLQRVVESDPVLYGAYGLHPCFLDDHSPQDLECLPDYLKSKRAVAVGEIGLDYFDSGADREQQTSYLREQLRIAGSLQLPVLLHVRKAHDQVLKLLRGIKLQRGGVVHAFSGSLQQAQIYSGLGFKLGIGGAATYDRARRLQKVIRDMPLDALVLETDAPDMPPSFARGRPNSPENLLRIAAMVAGIKGIPCRDLCEATTRNAISLFGLPI